MKDRSISVTATDRVAVTGARSGAVLPRWPLAVLFVGFPAWWLLGLVDLVWIPVAALMAALLVRSGRSRVPRGFGIWLLFLAWVTGSVVMVGSAGDLVGFVYRLLLYLSGTVLLVYVYNARATITPRYVNGTMTTLWGTTVVFGYLALALPTLVVRTPLALVLPQGLLANPLVDHMVVRRMTQYNPDSFLQVSPRPAAPFLYTNNWGNVYSLLLPFVVAYLFQVRRERRFPFLVAALALSTVPALLTLNRGMFLGIGVAMTYVAVRLIAMRAFRGVLAIAALATVGVLAFLLLPVEERLDNRLSSAAETTSTDTRASLYLQALRLVPGSPFLGYGAPLEGANPDAAPVGTQGQVWMLLVSHGPFATACFVGFLLVALVGMRRRRDPVGIACSTVLLVGVVELAYYGFLPYGLPILMVAAALGLRQEAPDTRTSGPERDLGPIS